MKVNHIIMKKTYLLLGSLLISICSFAQMDNLVNVSANWIASPARNAAANATDIVVYNPAATASLEEGLHINVGNQSLFRTPTHTYDLGMGAVTRKQNGSDPFLPNLYASFSKKNWSVFTGLFISGGGATANYPDGSITTDLIGFQSVMGAQGAYGDASAQYLKASSYYTTATIGGAYKFSDKISGSLSLRYLHGANNTQAGITLSSSPVDMPDMPMAIEFDESANAVNAVVSVFVQPSSKLGLSVRYESMAKMDFKTKVVKDEFEILNDGEKNRRDLPSVFAFGTSYKINNRLTALADINYYFQQNADWGTTTNANGESVSLSKAAGDAITYCIAFDYRVTDKFLLSFGGGYSDFMFNDMPAYYTHTGAFETVPNDNMNLNIGATYAVCKQLRFTAGYMNTSWSKDTKIDALMLGAGNQVTINNSINAIALGAEINF
jgi:long-subunit fatty acid transport protein